MLSESSQLWNVTFTNAETVCDGCWLAINGDCKRCESCDYDLCTNCLKTFRHDHEMMKKHVILSPPWLHVSCDECKNTIRGYQFRCKFCADYKLCSTCVKKEFHKSFHEVEQEVILLFNTVKGPNAYRCAEL